MHTFNLCVIASTKTEKYIKRLQNFVEIYGFKNFLNKETVKVSFLVADDSKPDFISDEFGWHNFPDIPVSLRFIAYLKTCWEPSLWTMQVDDDSSTDIDKTIELLHQFYDAHDSMILMGGRNTDLELGLQFVVKEMGENNILFNKNINDFKDIPYFIHAWEPSILSIKAVYKILKYTKFNQFFDLALQYNPIFTDQSIYLLSKLAKIPIVECLFLCPYDRPDEYSAFCLDGRYSHIHYVKEELGSYEKIIDSFKKIKNL
jgi:hypothetical protein